MKNKKLKKYSKTLEDRLERQHERNASQRNFIAKLATTAIQAQQDHAEISKKLDKAHQKIGELVMQQQ